MKPKNLCFALSKAERAAPFAFPFRVAPESLEMLVSRRAASRLLWMMEKASA